MIRFYLLYAFMFLLGGSVFAQDINVTVSVDMTGVTVDPTGVHLVGGFNGWDPTATPMTETAPGSGVYAAVVSRPVDDNIEYKVLNGNFYDRGPNGEGEEPTSPCSFLHNGNRVFTVPMADAALPTFAFGGCPPGVTRIPVTFQIDVAGLDVSQGVFVVGDMVGFNNDGFTAMSPIGNTSVYAVTIMLPADLLRVNFKYALGANFGGAEDTVPAPCANPDNSDRFYRFTGGTEETEVYFFNTCDVSNALPAEVLSFSAEPVGKTAQITWVTATEDAVERFELEHSDSGTDFRYLGSLPAAGNSRSNNRYTFTDEQPTAGTNYYRLTTVDQDGTRHVEGFRQVTIDAGVIGAKAFPNPVRNQLTVRFVGEAELRVLDTFGRTLSRRSATDGAEVNTTEFPAGHYFLILETKTGTQQLPFYKQ